MKRYARRLSERLRNDISYSSSSVDSAIGCRSCVAGRSRDEKRVTNMGADGNRRAIAQGHVNVIESGAAR
jgi:hypothetical protein